MPVQPSTDAKDTIWRCKVVEKDFACAPGVEPKCHYSHKTGTPKTRRAREKAKAFPTCCTPENDAATQMKHNHDIELLMNYTRSYKVPAEPSEPYPPEPGKPFWFPGVPGVPMFKAKPFWNITVIPVTTNLSRVRIHSEDGMYAYDSDELPAHLVAQGLGEFFFAYAREQFPDQLLEYTMAAKKLKKKEIEEVQKGNVKARVYPDGRVCLEHEGGLEELWIPKEDVGALIDCIGGVAEKTGARPTRVPSGRSYEAEDPQPLRLQPGQILPTSDPAISFPYQGQGKGLSGQAQGFGVGSLIKQAQQQQNALAQAQLQRAMQQTIGSMPIITVPKQHLNDCKCEGCEEERASARRYGEPEPGFVIAQDPALPDPPKHLNEKEFNSFLEYAMQYKPKTKWLKLPWRKKK